MREHSECSAMFRVNSERFWGAAFRVPSSLGNLIRNTCQLRALRLELRAPKSSRRAGDSEQFLAGEKPELKRASDSHKFLFIQFGPYGRLQANVLPASEATA
jgi:hypothetical protein